MGERRRKVAVLHRYGLAGNICCGGHNLPRTFEILHEHGVDVHFYGMRSTDRLPAGADRHVTIHELPITWDRANPSHKWSRTLVWYFVLPWLALWCRIRRFGVMAHADDTLPLTGWILLIFFGRNVVTTVMDFFCRIYTEKRPWLRPAGRAVEWLDIQSWRRIPVLLTKVYYIHEYLKARGVPAGNLYVERNPCDRAIFYPLLPDQRREARRELGWTEDDFVMTHHGIMHPNKGNDWIIRRIAELKDEIPGLKYFLMGDGPERGNLEALARELGIAERVIFPGWMPDERSLNRAINAGDVGLTMRMGQETDHFHMTDTLNHELACGNAVMAVRLRGIMEVIRDGENGMLFGHDAPEEFREKLLRLYRDPGLRERLGREALKTSHEVSDIEVCAHQVADPILRLLEKG